MSFPAATEPVPDAVTPNAGGLVENERGGPDESIVTSPRIEPPAATVPLPTARTPADGVASESRNCSTMSVKVVAARAAIQTQVLSSVTRFAATPLAEPTKADTPAAAARDLARAMLAPPRGSNGSMPAASIEDASSLWRSYKDGLGPRGLGWLNPLRLCSSQRWSCGGKAFTELELSRSCQAAASRFLSCGQEDGWLSGQRCGAEAS